MSSKHPLVTFPKDNVTRRIAQQPPTVAQFRYMLDSVDSSPLLDRLAEYRPTGRKGYPLAALWRAYLMRFLLNMPNMNAMIRRLQEDAALRRLCGFGRQLPHRTTFNRFVIRLSNHTDLVDACIAQLTEELNDEGHLAGLGEIVAIDSTNVTTHSNPERRTVSDTDASWTAKTKKVNGEKEWHFGFKFHLLVDARHGVPITGFTTTASKHDSLFLSDLLDKAQGLHRWFQPNFVIGDKGYDTVKNYRAVVKRNALPIIPAKTSPTGLSKDGLHLPDGTPTCLSLVPMEYVRSDPQRGHLFRCRPEGCKLKYRRGVNYCHDSEWFAPTENPRILGQIYRGSETWKAVYGLRQSVERVFKSVKESLSLNRHCVRGLRKVSLHALMSILAFQLTAITRLRLGEPELLRWMVRPVA